MTVRVFAARAAVTCLMLFVATPVVAQDDDEEYPIDPTLTGPYLGASMGVAFDSFSSVAELEALGDFGPSQLSSLILGYRGGEYVSLEAEFEFLSGFRSGQDEVDGWMTSLGFRIHVPLESRIEPYLTYGAGVLHMEGLGATAGVIDATDFALNVGGGVAYQWTDRFSVFAEGLYVYPISGVDGFNQGSLRFGLLYKFIED